MVQYEKFFQDYEKIEKMGLSAGYDPLKQKQMQESQQRAQQPVMKEITPEVQKIYQDMSAYCKKMNLMDRLIEPCTKRDASQRGMLSYQDILDSFKSFKMTLNTKQMTSITMPLPRDDLDGAFNYLIMIELLFGKDKALETQQRYKLQGMNTGQSSNRPIQQEQVHMKPLEMSQRFKDLIELHFIGIQNIAHQISKGSFKVKEAELANIFRRLNIVLLSQDLDLLSQAYHQLKMQSFQSMNFGDFIQYFHIQGTSSLILQQLQKELSSKNIKVEEVLLIQEQLTYEDFMKFITAQKIDLNKFRPEEVQNFFNQAAERKDKLDKSELIRLIKGDNEAKVEVLPFIVNEFLYHMINNNLKVPENIKAKFDIKQFQQWQRTLKYIPSNEKEMPILMNFFAFDGDTNFFSLVKLREQLSKFDHKPQQAKAPTQANSNQQQFSKQLSLFTQRIKQIMTKINEQLKRNGLNTKVIFAKMDQNKNGIIEKTEFINFFTKDLPITGLVAQDFDLLYDSLDMNKDGYLSVNEFCLCLEGVQLTLQQRMSSFDLDLEKSIKEEIKTLFGFFDTNKDGRITKEELGSIMRGINPYVGLKEIDEMMNQADANRNGSIDEQEFTLLMLPKMKEDRLSIENNLDDLRRLFKEADLDQSNYLNKDELRQALLKLQVELTEVQLDTLMLELDLDSNQAIDIDEFVAFLSIADQVQFKNTQNKKVVMMIKQSRKLQPTDFYNCFRNLPQFFLPSFTQEVLEKRYTNTPSYGVYPEFDSKTMTYKDLQKLEDVVKVPQVPQKKFIDMYTPALACEVQIEEATGVPLPKKDDYDWGRITHREVRAVLIDLRTQEFLSNTFILGATWRTEHQGKWLFNTSESLVSARNFIAKTDLLGKMQGTEQPRDIHLMFELVLYTNHQGTQQQVSCAWGTISALQFDKTAKHKVVLKGGSPFHEMKIDQADIHQEKKGFAFLKRAAAQTDDPLLIVNIKPWSKFQEQSQFFISTLPSTCLLSKRLLSFGSAFRVYCFRKLTKAQQQMIAPQGNFAIAQFRKIFDNPDVQYIMGECWEQEVTLKQQKAVVDIELLIKKMEEYMIKLYAIIYTQEFKFDHVYPTRSSGLESDRFFKRDEMIKSQLLPGKYKTARDAAKGKKEEAKDLEFLEENEDYKPFNIAEMEIAISGMNPLETKQDELMKMYQQMGLIY